MIIIYTDGATRLSNNIGGNGFVVVNGEQHVYTAVEVVDNTTNNQQELSGIIRALEWCEKNSLQGITVYTDSEYCQKGINQWIKGWKFNGWKTAGRKPVKNRELWERLDHLKSHTKPKVKWCRGHDTTYWNNYIDEQIAAAIDNQLSLKTT